MSARLLYRCAVAVLIFLATFLIHSQARVMTSTDSMWSIHTAKSILTDGDISLQEYSKEIERRGKYGVRIKRGEYYNYFPLGSSVLAIPFVYVYEQHPAILKFLIPKLWEIEARKGELPPVHHVSLLIERLVACLYVALSGALLFFILCKIVSEQHALILSLVFCFASSAMSVASRGLWQHGPNMFMLLIGCYCLMSTRAWILACSALPLGFAYIVRPTSGIAFMLGAAVLVLKHRSAALRYAILVMIPLVPFFIFNLNFFGGIIPPYYKASRLTFGPTTIEALLANLFSFSRGLFVFSPYLLTGLLVPLFFLQSEIYKLFRSPVPEVLQKLISIPPYVLFIIGYCLLHWIAVSAFPNWWGGHTFGPRYMSDTIPLLIILIAWLHTMLKSTQARNINSACIVILSLIVIKVHWYGSDQQTAWNWNVAPHNIDYVPSRVWEWRGSQFLRGLMH